MKMQHSSLPHNKTVLLLDHNDTAESALLCKYGTAQSDSCPHIDVVHMPKHAHTHLRTRGDPQYDCTEPTNRHMYIEYIDYGNFEWP